MIVELEIPHPSNIDASSSTDDASTSRRSTRLRRRFRLDESTLGISEGEESALIKKLICEHIFRSDYFNMLEEDWMDLDQRPMYTELKKRHRGLFREIFSKRNKKGGLKLLMCGAPANHFREQYGYHYVNSSRKRSISIKGKDVEKDVDENVFICLVKKRNSRKEVKQYFVSEEYNVNAAHRNSQAPYITGRFIFEFNSENDIVISALAEEPAKVRAHGGEAEIKYAEIMASKPQVEVILVTSSNFSDRNCLLCLIEIFSHS